MTLRHLQLFLVIVFMLILTTMAEPVSSADQPTYVIAFIPVDWSGSEAQFEIEAQRQAELFVVESGIDKYAHVELQIVDEPLEGVSLTNVWLVQEVVAFGLQQYPADRYIGLTDGDLALSGDSGVVGWTAGPDSLGVVVEAGETEVTAHELGHTFALCDEYFYPYWEEQDGEWGCPNAFPSNCRKSDTTFCLGFPAEDGRNSMMGPAGLRGGYAYNTPSITHLQQIFNSMFDDPTAPDPEPTSEPTPEPSPVPPTGYLNLAFSNPNLIRLADGELVELVKGPVFHPDWSVDSQWIAFAAPFAGNSDLYRVAANGGRPERLTDTPGRELHPAWLSGGEQLIFTSDAPGVQSLFILQVATGSQEQLDSLPVPASWPAVSEKEQRLAFSAAPRGDWELYIVDLDPEGYPKLDTLFQVTNTSGIDASPAWSPDGTALAFASEQNGNMDIYLYKLDTAEVVRLTDSAANEWAPKWLSDGQIIYHAFDGHALGLYVLDLGSRVIERFNAGAAPVSWPAVGPEQP